MVEHGVSHSIEHAMKDLIYFFLAQVTPALVRGVEVKARFLDLTH
jgi:hypothetical protein